MSYLLEFPSTTLPDNFRDPPYVIFGIKGQSVVEHLPPKIPLRAVLHFVPTLAHWVLPTPRDVPSMVVKKVLHTPYVGIDIHLDIGVASLQCIVLKITQIVGFAVPRSILQHQPSIITSISIRKTWLLLELPKAGIDGLLIYLQTRLAIGPPVILAEMKELWANFPSNDIVVRLMTINFVQSHLGLHYGHNESAAIKQWYRICKERLAVFKAAEKQFPEIGEEMADTTLMQDDINSNATGNKKRAREPTTTTDKETATLQAITKKQRDVQDGQNIMSTLAEFDSVLRFRKRGVGKSKKLITAHDLKDEVDTMGTLILETFEESKAGV